MEVSELDDKELAVAQIVSAIISKEDVIIGADVENGVHVHIKAAHEMTRDYRGTVKLPDLIKMVRESL